MEVCRYFLQGSCKFGNSCFNEHPRGGSEGYSVTAQRQLFGGGREGGNSKVTFKDSFGGNQSNSNPYKWVSQDVKQKQGQPARPTPAADIIKQSSTETNTWIHSGMWPFSCVGYEKDAACIPGFEDVHPDELRREAYEALKSGNIQPYVQKVEGLMNEVSSKRAELKNPSMTFKQQLGLGLSDWCDEDLAPDQVSFIEDCRRKEAGINTENNLIFDGASAGQDGASAGLFGQASSSSSSPFSQPSQSLFGQSGQQAFSQPSPSPFGQLAGQQTFGQTAGQQTFGQTSEQQTLFGKPVPSGQPAVQSVFGQSQASGQSAPGQAAPVASLFGKPMITPAFPVTPSTPQSFFGGPSTGTSGRTFGNTIVVPSGATSGAPVPQTSSQPATNSMYTPIDSLTASQLEQFHTATFTLGTIPTRPPPRELCL